WPVAACLDAKRGQVYVQTFAPNAAGPEPIAESRAWPPERFAATLVEKTLVVGDGIDEYRDALIEASGGLAVPVAAGLCYHRAGSVAILAERRFAAGLPVAPLAPLYLRSWDAQAVEEPAGR
ncbi:MAG: hypothetical protein KJ042_04945, partial [Deltaproteobacteria bacterium]|nr:hypothetical protein [Deltaproteobacteria bacterium]